MFIASASTEQFHRIVQWKLMLEAGLVACY